MKHPQKTIRSALEFSLLMAIASGLLVAPALQASGIDEAVNKAGKQRMITQRIMKDYALIGMNMNIGNPGDDLKTLVDEFDASLKSLQQLTATAAFAASLNEVEALWTPIREVLQQPPNKEAAPKLQQDLDTLLDACDKNTRLLATSTGDEKENIINIAGRQRMLSQRMAALYMLETWKLEDPRFNQKLQTAMNEFSSAHKTLESSSLSNSEIKALLKKVKKSYMWFEMMGKSRSSRVIPSLINKSADSILLDMDKATRLYIHSRSN